MAVANDAYSTGLAGSGSSWSHTVGGGSNMALLAFVYSTAVITGMTYNSVAMTELSRFVYSSFPMAIWGLLAPAAGAHNIVCTGGGGIYSAGLSASGVGSFGDFSQNPDLTVNCGSSDAAAFIASALDSGFTNCGSWPLGGVVELGTGSPTVTATNSWTGVQLVAPGGGGGGGGGASGPTSFFNIF